jgi:hypothetical protein
MGEYPVLIGCRLCGARIASRPARSWLDAMDHAIDEHRAQLLADATVPDFLTVSAGESVQPLRPRACPTGGVR